MSIQPEPTGRRWCVGPSGPTTTVIADAAQSSGDGEAAGHLFTRAVQQAQASDPQLGDPLDHARVTAEHAAYLINRGEIHVAEQLLQQAHELFATAGSEQEAAVCQGTVADILYRRGDYDEALRIRREVQLPVFERLGDTREAAVTWGKIADILHWRGDYDEALRIRREVQLPVFERLGDTRSAAIAWGKIADILYQRGDHDEAAELRAKELEVNERLRDLDGIALAKWGLAQIELARENYRAAFPLLVESFRGFQQLDRPDGIAVVGGALGQLLLAAKDYDRAKTILATSQTAADKIGATELSKNMGVLIAEATQTT